MRIAQLIQTLGVGGAERLVLEISGALADKGFESHLIVLDGSGPMAELRHPGIIYHDLQLDMAGGLSSLPKTVYQIHKSLGQIISNHKLQVIQTHLPMANFWGLTLGWQNAVKVLATVHNNEEFVYGEHAGPARQRMRRLAYGQMLRHTMGMVAVSQAVKEAMVEALGVGPALSEQIKVVPNGVPIGELPTEAEKITAREKLGIPVSATVLASVGRLSEQKNYRDLIEALALLEEKNGEWVCVIAGTGPLEKDLRAQVERKGLGKKIIFYGYLSDPRLLYSAADVFVMPSLWEGLPMALLEAMASGLPIAGYSIAGIEEIVEDNIHGLLAAKGDVKGLAASLSKFLDDPINSKKMGTRARELVSSQYSFSKVISQLTTLYSG